MYTVLVSRIAYSMLGILISIFYTASLTKGNPNPVPLNNSVSTNPVSGGTPIVPSLDVPLI